MLTTGLLDSRISLLQVIGFKNMFTTVFRIQEYVIYWSIGLKNGLTPGL